jgi:hypothetical protein
VTRRQAGDTVDSFATHVELLGPLAQGDAQFLERRKRLTDWLERTAI